MKQKHEYKNIELTRICAQNTFNKTSKFAILLIDNN